MPINVSICYFITFYAVIHYIFQLFDALITSYCAISMHKLMSEIKNSAQKKDRAQCHQVRSFFTQELLSLSSNRSDFRPPPRFTMLKTLGNNCVCPYLIYFQLTAMFARPYSVRSTPVSLLYSAAASSTCSVMPLGIRNVPGLTASLQTGRKSTYFHGWDFDSFAMHCINIYVVAIYHMIAIISFLIYGLPDSQRMMHTRAFSFLQAYSPR